MVDTSVYNGVRILQDRAYANIEVYGAVTLINIDIAGTAL